MRIDQPQAVANAVVKQFASADEPAEVLLRDRVRGYGLVVFSFNDQTPPSVGLLP